MYMLLKYLYINNVCLLVFVVDSDDVTINVVDKYIKDVVFDDDITICVVVQVNPII